MSLFPFPAETLSMKKPNWAFDFWYSCVQYGAYLSKDSSHAINGESYVWHPLSFRTFRYPTAELGPAWRPLVLPLWVRHIIVEGYTDKEEDLIELGEFIGTLKNLHALDVLPYHTMGVNKYKELGIPYKLDGLDALPMNEAVKAKEHIIKGIKNTRK